MNYQNCVLSTLCLLIAARPRICEKAMVTHSLDLKEGVRIGLHCCESTFRSTEASSLAEVSLAHATAKESMVHFSADPKTSNCAGISSQGRPDQVGQKTNARRVYRNTHNVLKKNE